MKNRIAICIFAGLMLAGLPAFGANLYWSGTGNWDTVNQVWGTASGGPYNQAIWNNATNDTAVFEGTAGTTTLTEGITVGGITLNVKQTVTGNTLTLASGTQLNSTVGTDTTTTPIISSVLSGTNGFTKTGSGWLQLSAASSSLSGNINIQQGTLYAAHAALGTGGLVFTGNSQFIKVYNTNNNMPATMSVTVNPGVSATISGGSFYFNAYFAGALQGGDTSTLTVSPGSNVEFQFNNTSNTFTGALNLTGTGTADNGSRVVFKSLPDSGQKISVNNAVFRLANGGVAMNFANRPIEMLNNGARFDNDSTDAAVTMTFQQNLSARIGNNARTLTLSGVNTGNNTYAGVISNSANGTGAVSVTKSEAGKWILSGANTYTGATTVSAGTLLINGNQSAATGAVTVANTAKLGGTGIIGGSVTVNSGGTLAPGASIESLATGALTLNAGSTFAYEIDKSVARSVGGDLMAVTGNLALAATNDAVLTLTELGASGAWAIGDKLTLISYSGSWNGGLFNYSSSILNNNSTFTFSGVEWKFRYDDTTAGTNFVADLTGPNYVTMTVIPEPGTLGMLAIFGLGILARRRLLAKS